MRWLVALMSSLWLVTAPAAECLEVRNSQVEEIQTEYEMTTVEWTADIMNTCNASYDGTFTVKLLNQQGSVLHETLEVMILQKNASEPAAKRITLPADSYKAMDSIEIDIRERERPF